VPDPHRAARQADRLFDPGPKQPPGSKLHGLGAGEPLPGGPAG
jgi:hypothetical protein